MTISHKVARRYLVPRLPLVRIQVTRISPRPANSLLAMAIGRLRTSSNKTALRPCALILWASAPAAHGLWHDAGAARVSRA